MFCASTSHPGTMAWRFAWTQFQLQKSFTNGMNGKGIYINAPDVFSDALINKPWLSKKLICCQRETAKNPKNRQKYLWCKLGKNSFLGWGFVLKKKKKKPYLLSWAESRRCAETEMSIWTPLSASWWCNIRSWYSSLRPWTKAIWRTGTKMNVTEVIDCNKTNRDILNADIIRLSCQWQRKWDGFGCNCWTCGKWKGLGCFQSNFQKGNWSKNHCIILSGLKDEVWSSENHLPKNVSINRNFRRKFR